MPQVILTLEGETPEECQQKLDEALVYYQSLGLDEEGRVPPEPNEAKGNWRAGVCFHK